MNIPSARMKVLEERGSQKTPGKSSLKSAEYIESDADDSEDEEELEVERLI